MHAMPHMLQDRVVALREGQYLQEASLSSHWQCAFDQLPIVGS
jgi:hypothetical protein